MELYAYTYPSRDAAKAAYERAHAVAMDRGEVSIWNARDPITDEACVIVCDPAGGLREQIAWGPDAVERELSDEERRALIMRRLRVCTGEGEAVEVSADGQHVQQDIHYEHGQPLYRDGSM